MRLILYKEDHEASYSGDDPGVPLIAGSLATKDALQTVWMCSHASCRAPLGTEFAKLFQVMKVARRS